MTRFKWLKIIMLSGAIYEFRNGTFKQADDGSIMITEPWNYNQTKMFCTTLDRVECIEYNVDQIITLSN